MKELYYFSADWCQPCTTLGPIMERVQSQIPVKKINVDYMPDVVKVYGIRNIPTVILAENGKEIRRFTGIKSYEEIMNFIK